MLRKPAELQDSAGDNEAFYLRALAVETAENEILHLFPPWQQKFVAAKQARNIALARLISGRFRQAFPLRLPLEVSSLHACLHNSRSRSVLK